MVVVANQYCKAILIRWLFSISKIIPNEVIEGDVGAAISCFVEKMYRIYIEVTQELLYLE